MKNKKVQIHKRAEIAGRLLIHDDNQLFIAPLKNLSAGGLFATRLAGLTVGKKVRVVVKSRALRASIQTQGVVVRIQKNIPQGTAIEFTEISTKDKEIIETCVQETKMESLLKT